MDYSKDFFSKPSYLTVSGQLNGEYYACALSNIYTFGELGPLCGCGCGPACASYIHSFSAITYSFGAV